MRAKHIERPSQQTPSRGRADLEAVRRMTEEEIVETSPPELAEFPDDFWDEADVGMPEPKEAIPLRVDQTCWCGFERVDRDNLRSHRARPCPGRRSRNDDLTS